MRKMTRRNGLRVAGEVGGRQGTNKEVFRGLVRIDLQCRLKRGRSLGKYVCVIVGIFQSLSHVLCLVSVDIKKRNLHSLSDVCL